MIRTRYGQYRTCLLPEPRRKLGANEEYEPMSFDFPDEDLMAVLQIEKKESPKEDGWKMYFDRASNALGRAVGDVLISLKGNHCPFTAKLSFECPNNVAEYEACVMGLQAAIEKKIKELTVYGDSALVHMPINWRMGNQGLKTCALSRVHKGTD